MTTKQRLTKRFTALLNKWSKLNKIGVTFIGVSVMEHFLSTALDTIREETLKEAEEWLKKELKGVDTTGKAHEQIFNDFDHLKHK